VIVGTRDGRMVGRMVGVGVGRCVGRTVGACGYDTAQRVATKHTSLATQPSGRARSRRRCGRVSRPVRCSCGRASGNADGLDAATVGGGGRTRSTACGTARQRMGTITLRPSALLCSTRLTTRRRHLPRLGHICLRLSLGAHPCRKALSYTVQSTPRTAKAHRRRWQRRQRSWAERRRDRRQRRWLERRRERVARPCTVRKLLHLHRDWAHPCHICTGTGLTPPTSAPGPGHRLSVQVPEIEHSSSPAGCTAARARTAAHPRRRQPHHCIAARRIPDAASKRTGAESAVVAAPLQRASMIRCPKQRCASGCGAACTFQQPHHGESHPSTSQKFTGTTSAHSQLTQLRSDAIEAHTQVHARARASVEAHPHERCRSYSAVLTSGVGVSVHAV
jgi:hypothetical protein